MCIIDDVILDWVTDLRSGPIQRDYGSGHRYLSHPVFDNAVLGNEYGFPKVAEQGISECRPSCVKYNSASSVVLQIWTVGSVVISIKVCFIDSWVNLVWSLSCLPQYLSQSVRLIIRSPGGKAAW